MKWRCGGASSPRPHRRGLIEAFALDDGTASLRRHDLASEEVLDQVPGIAPGWDKHHLAATYVAYVNGTLGGKRPDRRDAAFLGWVKKFTKSKRPS